MIVIFLIWKGLRLTHILRGNLEMKKNLAKVESDQTPWIKGGIASKLHIIGREDYRKLARTLISVQKK
jgi:hypothetical protein